MTWERKKEEGLKECVYGDDMEREGPKVEIKK